MTGIPFHPQAPAGAELTRYLNGLALPERHDIYLTNLVKEWEAGASTKKKDVTAADIARDEWELKCELASVEPQIVGALGRHSARWLLSADLEMDAVHGLLFEVRYCWSCGARVSWLGHTAGLFEPCLCGVAYVTRFYVVPIYHPAAGLHQPELAARVAYDMAQLAALLKDPASWPERAWRPAPKGLYADYDPDGDSPPPGLEHGIDTEGTPDAPYCVSLSATPGYAEVARFAEMNGTLVPQPQHIPHVRWIFHNYLWDRKVLAAKGIEFDDAQIDDTMVMAYLLGVEPQSLKDLALRHLGRVRKTFEEVYGTEIEVLGKSGKVLKKKKKALLDFDDVPRQTTTDYAGADADDTLSLKPILWKKIQDLDLEGVYAIDTAVLPLYSRMEQVGLPIDLEYFDTLGQALAEELAFRTASLQSVCGSTFNPASADQVAVVLFKKLGLPGWKKTPSGKRFTTDDKILQALTGLDDTGIVEAIIEWREVSKLKTTFVDPIKSYCVVDHQQVRLRFQLLPTRVVSGRVAYKNPNVGAFPKYGRGRQVRAGFSAVDGRKLGSFDLNQIELRVLALDSCSATLRELFQKGIDQHGQTAARIFGGAPGDYKEGAKRVAAKAVNFSIPMGTTKFGLAEQMRKHHYPFPELAGLAWPTREARMNAEAEVCDQWIKTVIGFWGIEPYLSEQRSMARRFGYVADRWGRKRFLPSVLSPSKQIREEALRQAQAFGPQAGARGFMKTIEARVWREVIKPLTAGGYYMVPLLDLHDDLTCEFQEDLTDYFLDVVGSIFNHTFHEAIPITAKGSDGQTWADL